MPLASSDPSMLLYYSLNEAGYKAVRANLGSLGSAYDVIPAQSTGSDGIPTVSDGNGGKMVDLFRTRTGWTSAIRYLHQATYPATRALHLAAPAMPLASAAGDFAFGVRFKWTGQWTSGGGQVSEVIFGVGDAGSAIRQAFGLRVLPASMTVPTVGRLAIGLANQQYIGVYDDASHSATGSPADDYIVLNYTYRVIVRVYNTGVNTYVYKVYVYEEDTGVLYTFTRTSNIADDYLLAYDANPHTVMFGYTGSSASLSTQYIDEAWLYDAPVSDDDATRIVYAGLTAPWTEPDYNIDPPDVRITACKEGGTFPPSRSVGVGVLKSVVPYGLRCQRMRLRYEGNRPGRPTAIRTTQVEFNSSGPRAGKRGNMFTFPDPKAGFIRQLGPLPPTALVDGRNISLEGLCPRTRRGYRTRRDIGTGQTTGASNFTSYRTLSDGLVRLYKVGDKIYIETGSGVAQIDAGHTTGAFASFGELGGRTFILTPARQSMHMGEPGSVQEFGEDGPTSVSAATGVGGTLAGEYYYLVTYYDPDTGDETAPAATSTTVSPATQKVALTITSSSPAARFTHMRIYRSADAQGPTTATLIDTVAVGTSYEDTGEPDGVIQIGVVNSTYITGTPPETFGAGTVHKERCFYYMAQDNPDRLYWTEAGEMCRFYGNAYLRAEAPIRFVLSQGQRLIIGTDRTLEIVESDFIRDDLGSYSMQRTVISRTVGGLNHLAAVNAHGRVFWMDGRGAWTLDGDMPVKISEMVQGLWKFINTNLKSQMYVTYNHLTQQIWFGMSLSGDIQSSPDAKSTVLAYQFDKRAWCPPYEIVLDFADSFDDDFNGIRFGGITRAGTFVELETYEGDGIAGDEAITFEGTLDTEVAAVVTPTPAPTGWTTNSLRGFGVTLYNSTTGAWFYSIIISNTTTTFTMLDEPDVDFDDQAFYIGGFRWWMEPAEQDAETPNDKVLVYIRTEFDDLSSGRVF